jgi:hypothetical protein
MEAAEFGGRRAEARGLQPLACPLNPSLRPFMSFMLFMVRSSLRVIRVFRGSNLALRKAGTDSAHGPCFFLIS